MPTYETVFCCTGLGDDADTPLELAEQLEEAAAWLRAAHEAGVRMESPPEDGHAVLTTDDAKVAEEFGLTEPDEGGCCQDDEECCCQEDAECGDCPCCRFDLCPDCGEDFDDCQCEDD